MLLSEQERMHGSSEPATDCMTREVQSTQILRGHRYKERRGSCFGVWGSKSGWRTHLSPWRVSSVAAFVLSCGYKLLQYGNVCFVAPGSFFSYVDVALWATSKTALLATLQLLIRLVAPFAISLLRVLV
jgi:hypothetical protein